MSTTVDTFSTSHMIDHEFNEYEFPSNAVLFQYPENNDNSFELEEEACFYSDEEDFSLNQENELLEKALGCTTEETLQNTESAPQSQACDTTVPVTSSPTDEETNPLGEYAAAPSQEEIDQPNEEINEEEQETDDSENSITPILLTYCSQKYHIFTDETNPDISISTPGSQSNDQVIFSNQPELYSQSLKSFMKSIQSHFKIINDIVIFFPTLKLKFYSHIPFAEKLSLRDIAFLASNVNPQSNILEIELSEEPYNFVSQYQLLINRTREELSDEENLPVDQQQEQSDEEEINEQINLGKRHRNQTDLCDSDSEENIAKRQKY